MRFIYWVVAKLTKASTATRAFLMGAYNSATEVPLLEENSAHSAVQAEQYVQHPKRSSKGRNGMQRSPFFLPLVMCSVGGATLVMPYWPLPVRIAVGTIPLFLGFVDLGLLAFSDVARGWRSVSNSTTAVAFPYNRDVRGARIFARHALQAAIAAAFFQSIELPYTSLAFARGNLIGLAVTVSASCAFNALAWLCAPTFYTAGRVAAKVARFVAKALYSTNDDSD